MKKTFYAILGISILFACFAIYKNEIFLYPSHIHAWTQSDKYALALCFLDNGFDFFHPCTFLHTELNSTITAVDFPFHEYIVAILMKILGTKSPAVFRIYTLLYSLVGLYCLYRLSLLLSRSIYLSVFIVFFTFFSPLYLYYQISFLPSLTSISSLFIGIYFIFNYYNSNKQKHFWIGISFLTLGSLCRLPFMTFVIALALSFGIEYFKTKKIAIHQISGILLSMLFVGSYFLYNSYLRKVYGSIFLGHMLPAESLEDFIKIIKSALEQWAFHYFTLYHYIIFLLLLLAFILTKGFQKTTLLSKKFMFFMLISLAGVFCYAVLMIRQFNHHDYYFLDTFFSVIIFITVFLYSHIELNKSYLKITYQIVLASSVFFIIFQSLATNNYRTTSAQWNIASVENENFSGSSTFLDSIGVPRSSKILVLGASTANMPFVLMERTGYLLMEDDADSVSKALRHPCDYIVLQNSTTSQTIVLNNPDLINQLIKIGDNGGITVYKKGKPANKASLIEFMGFTETVLKKNILINFDSTIADSSISTFEWKISDTIFHSKPNSGILREEFRTIIKLDGSNTKSKQLLTCYFEGYFKSDEEGPFFLIASIDDSLKKNISYQSFTIITNPNENAGWTKTSFPLQLLALTESRVATFYFYNPQRKKLYCDDLLLLVR